MPNSISIDSVKEANNPILQSRKMWSVDINIWFIMQLEWSLTDKIVALNIVLVSVPM